MKLKFNNNIIKKMYWFTSTALLYEKNTIRFKHNITKSIVKIEKIKSLVALEIIIIYKLL